MFIAVLLTAMLPSRERPFVLHPLKYLLCVFILSLQKAAFCVDELHSGQCFHSSENK